MLTIYLYTYIFFFFYIIILFFTSFILYNYTRIFSFFFFSIINIINLLILLIINKFIIWYQFICKFFSINFLQISYIIGIDYLTIIFLIICSILLMICYLTYWNFHYKINLYSITLIITLLLLFNTFASIDLFLFFIFFESIIIPMFLLISIYGSRSRRFYASYLLISYTLLGSIFILINLFYIYSNIGSTAIIFIINSNIYNINKILIFLAFFFGFGVKIPIIPLHIWLPEAHVEAPTTGSIILAGIILKIGIFILIKLLCGLFYNINKDIFYPIIIFNLLGFIYASQTALSQIDMKKTIAYSSIAHMNFAILGLLHETIIGYNGLIYLMVGHAITSSALFFGIGILYDRYKTRIICYYNSITIFMPIFSSIYFIFILSNFSFPLTSNFIGEFLIMGSIINKNILLFIFIIIPSVLSLIYTLFLYNRLFFGPINIIFIRKISDLTRIEALILFLFLLFNIFWGFSLYPYNF